MTRTKIGTILNEGDPIPPDVTGILDRESDPWMRTKAGHWHCLPGRVKRCDRGGGDCDDVETMLMFVPLTVVLVAGFISPATQPRQARFWPQIGERVDDLPATVDVFGNGRWVLNPTAGTYRRTATFSSDPHTLNELRLLGAVTEVLS